jgi:GAF domain-containing protein
LFFLPTPAEGADFVLRLLGELVPCEASAVALYDINTDELRFVAAHGVGAEERKGDAVPAQAGILGATIRLHEVCTTVDDLGTDARFDPGVDGRVGLEATNTAVVGVWANGRLLGAFQLLNRIGDLEFGAADANLLVYVSNRFGAFLHQHKVAEVKRPSRTVTGRR